MQQNGKLATVNGARICNRNFRFIVIHSWLFSILFIRSLALCASKTCAWTLTTWRFANRFYGLFRIYNSLLFFSLFFFLFLFRLPSLRLAIWICFSFSFSSYSSSSLLVLCVHRESRATVRSWLLPFSITSSACSSNVKCSTMKEERNEYSTFNARRIQRKPQTSRAENEVIKAKQEEYKWTKLVKSLYVQLFIWIGVGSVWLCVRFASWYWWRSKRTLICDWMWMSRHLFVLRIDRIASCESELTRLVARTHRTATKKKLVDETTSSKIILRIFFKVASICRLLFSMQFYATLMFDPFFLSIFSSFIDWGKRQIRFLLSLQSKNRWNRFRISNTNDQLIAQHFEANVNQYFLHFLFHIFDSFH